MHTPVLLKETIEALDVSAGGKYIDTTYGEGGHAREIIKRGGRVLAIEWDEKQIQKAKLKIKNLKVVWGNFKNVEKIARENKFLSVDGILFDLGLSMNQLKEGRRGFSYKKAEEPLDMRISKSLKLKAADIINNSTAGELYEIFSTNSEEVNSWPIAKAIFFAGRIRKINTVGGLISAMGKFGKKVSTLRRIFQALRIKVNDEFNNLKSGLSGAAKILKPEGKILVITFNSLEDRIVKNFVRENKMQFAQKKPITSSSGLGFEKTAKLRIIL